MNPIIDDVILAVSSSLAASILVKVTITTALALIGTRLARKSRAAVRHVLLAAAFGMLLMVPIASLVVPTVRVAVPIAAQQASGPAAFERIFEAQGRVGQ